MKNAMMQASMNPYTKNAKYIIFKNNGYQFKYDNPNVGVLTNKHKDADPNITLVYELYTCI
jgi:hypothetical protein